MRDPAPPPNPFIFNAVKPYADALSLPTLPYHIHEIIFAFVFYQSLQSLVSPVLSTFLFPNIYPKLNPRTRVNWDVHVVSLVQSLLINGLALWIMFADTERYDMKTSVLERVYGYTGASGLIQGLAAGYFMWDLLVSTRYLRIFGIGILAHAITALLVFSFGFRPFCNYYGPVFILYELSTPFLNVHWFCDKLNLTGSLIQWYNGMILIGTFFGARLCWGTYQSLRVYQDIWQGLHLDTATQYHSGQSVNNPSSSIFVPRDGQLCLGDKSCVAAQSEVMKFTGPNTGAIPVWLAAVYLVSNITLNSLNFYWFGKMIETVRKRFEPSDEKGQAERDSRRKSVVEHAADELDREVLSGPRTPAVEKAQAMAMSSAVADKESEVNKRR